MSGFVTNVGLITSNGIYCNNIMAAEWTYRISNDPFLFLISLGYESATLANIKTSKEFGINLASRNQNVIASIAGNNTGKDVDKIKVLQKLGFEFYEACTINSLMIKGAVLNAECTLKKILELGDHCVVIGEVKKVNVHESDPLLYHKKKFYTIGEGINKPGENKLITISKIIQDCKKENHYKSSLYNTQK